MSQMREEFEAWVVTQGSSIMRCGTIHDPSPVYMYVETQAMWLAWKASREALAVELPVLGSEVPMPENPHTDDEKYRVACANGYNAAIELCRQSIEAAGVKVKP